MCMPLALSSIFIQKLTIPLKSCIFSLLVFGIIFLGVAQNLWNVGITKTNLRTVSVLHNVQIIIFGMVFKENVVLYDSLCISVGEKLAEAELIGIPY